MGDTIIGRKSEKDTLSDIYQSNKSEFVAVYGRRRIGKTYLIEQFFGNKCCDYFSVTGLNKGTLKEHLTIFAKEISEVFFKGMELQIESSKNWMSAFELLTNALNKFAKEKRIVLFFDELPWLASKRSGFKKALEYYWNTKWSKNKKIILVVCGSAASWMINNIVNDKGGLHNRVTLQLSLYPFSLRETYDFLTYRGNNFTQRQVLELYMALGGVPHYLEKIKPHLSAAQNISRLFFLKKGALFNEFDILFASLFDKAEAYIELITIIASKRQGVTRSDISSLAKLSKTGGSLTLRLTALEEAGFIKSFLPIGYMEKGLYYKLVDEYCYFYLKWIKPIKRQIENESEPNYWEAKVNSPAWYSWSGYAFEAVCLKHVSLIKRGLYIPPGALSGSWKCKSCGKNDESGAQIDLLFDRDDGIITLCEIKYNLDPYEITRSYAQALRAKIDIFKKQTNTKKQVFLSMVTTGAVKKNKHSVELITSSIMLDDLFQ